MCSIGEGDFADDGAVHAMPVTEPTTDTLDLTQICKKCNAENVVLKLAAREPQCRSCFLAYAHHKFRAALGSSKVLPRDVNVVLVVDGSAKSIVLLDMCRFALQLDQFRKLRFNPKILFLDEQPLVERPVVKRILTIIRGYSFEMFYQHLGSSSDPVPITDQLDITTFEKDREKFLESFNSLKSLTSKQDFLIQLRKRNWRSCAKALNCNLVLVPETNSDLARTLLIDISLGRGATAAHDVSFIDDREDDVKLVRPIRDLNEDEVNHYLQLNNLEFVPDIGLFGDTQPSGASIQNLTGEFVKNLQKNYSATITTVFRTGDKMAPLKDESTGKCRICHCQLDTVSSETLYATKLSSYLSTNPPAEDNNIEQQINKLNLTGNHSDLCHACHSFSKDTSGAKEFIFDFNDS